MSQAAQDPGTMKVGAAFATRQYLVYLACLLLLLPLLYVLPVIALQSKALRSYVHTTFGPLLATSYETKNEDADVVIFGDSTAMYGVDPLQASRELGLKVMNLPNTAGSLPVTGDEALKAYLKNNRPPRLLVFYFSSWNLNYEKNALLRERSFEGEEMLLRFGSQQRIRRYAASHKGSAVQFPFRMYFVGAGPTLAQWFIKPDEHEALEQKLGHIEMSPDAKRMEGGCSIPGRFLKPAGDDAVQALLAAYAPQLPTMVYIAPVPGCQGAEELTGRSFDDLHAAPPREIPASMFLADTLYAHPAPVGVPVATENFVAAVRKQLAR
jgi:hypothetical protein